MDRFECERCGTTKTASVIFGMPSGDTFEFVKNRKDVILGGCGRRPGAPDFVCIVCHWPMENDWTTFDGPLGEFDSFQRPLDQALAEYDSTDGRIELLALSFDGYSAFGGTDEVYKLIKGVEKRWERNGKLPTNLGRLRTCLFFEQRASHHNGSPLLRPYTEALVNAIREAAAIVPHHGSCFVCGPGGLGIDFSTDGVEGESTRSGWFIIGERWADGAGVISQGLVAAILDECFTRAAWQRSHRPMRARTVNSFFSEAMSPGRRYKFSYDASGGSETSVEATARILNAGGGEIARAVAVMELCSLPAFVFVPDEGDDDRSWEDRLELAMLRGRSVTP